MLGVNLLLYLIAFGAIWVGSGFIVRSLDTFSRKLHLSSFAISFVILGLLTSTPEFAVGLQAVADNDAEIFIGNLLGGIPILFLLVIPLLAILGNGINLRHELDRSTLLIALGVILAPSLLLLDKRITIGEGILLIFLYFMLVAVVQRKKGFLSKVESFTFNFKAFSYKDMLKVLLGVGIVFISSSIIVDKTLYFADVFSISPFYISLFAISLGTNLPELSLALRSVFSGNRDVAMGDYIGSAAVNTLFFGIFTILSAGEVLTVNNFFSTFAIITVALVLFFIFSQTGRTITRREGFVLLSGYFVFVVFELFLK